MDDLGFDLGEAFKREYNSENGMLARIHVRVWDERAYPVLKKAMRDNDPEVRHYATEAVKYLESYKFSQPHVTDIDFHVFTTELCGVRSPASAG